ncbi:MAG: peptide ABC transporter substrate-binding protein, partial [Halobacteria archaeon]|nr:peptide ABC transporter substrate-binding protein [Halobacteria archaeon]
MSLTICPESLRTQSARLYRMILLVALLTASACSDEPWNRPYPAAEAHQNTLYASFQERPNHLDPVQSYSSNEVAFTAQIYEPPLQYHYLKRPYGLIPLAATGVPEPYYIDAQGRRIGPDAEAADIAYSVYDIHIQPGIRYQPHPAFALDTVGNYRYYPLDAQALEDIYTLGDFTETGSRELVADDYVYQIKRLAHPHLHSPILGLMSDYIVGLADYVDSLEQAAASPGQGFLD